MTCYYHRMDLKGTTLNQNESEYLYKCWHCGETRLVIAEEITLNGRVWHPRIVAAMRADRDFYLGSTIIEKGFTFHRVPYIQLLQSLMNSYECAGISESAQATQQNIDEIKFILGVT